MSFLFSNRAIAALGVGVVLSRRRMKREDVEAKTAWSLSEFELLSPINGISKFQTSSWSDFITFKNSAGESTSLIWPHAIAKNYSEIAISNLFRYALKLDPNILKSPAWQDKGFFMRYQELEFSSEFYEALSCPRIFQSPDAPTSNLHVHTNIIQVGKSSAVAEQLLVVDGKRVGKNLQQITCIERGKAGASPLPDEFLELEYIKPLRKAPRPNFPRTFLPDESMEEIGSVKMSCFQSDTDENCHMNESVYLRNSLDAIFHCEKLTKKDLQVEKIQALYHKEILAGKTVDVKVYRGADGVYVTSFTVDGNFSFQSRIKTRRI